LDMVVVSTSEARGGPRQIAALVESFITQAAKSPKPLPENPDMVAQLDSLVEKVGRPANP